jgi:hypothetical protein
MSVTTRPVGGPTKRRNVRCWIRDATDVVRSRSPIVTRTKLRRAERNAFELGRDSAYIQLSAYVQRGIDAR